MTRAIDQMRILMILAFFGCAFVTLHAGLMWGFHKWPQQFAVRVLFMAYAGLSASIAGWWLLDRERKVQHDRRGFPVERKDE